MRKEQDFMCDFKKVKQWRPNQETHKFNIVLRHIETKNIIVQTDNLIKAANGIVAESVGLRNTENRTVTDRRKKQPWWKRRISEDINSPEQCSVNTC